MAQDLEKEYADFMTNRQNKIDAERTKDAVSDDRTEYGSGFNNPPAVRGTDGLPPGTPEQNPIKMAAEADTGNAFDDETETAVTSTNTVAEIKAYLDEQGIQYDPAAKKSDLVALLPA